MTSKHPAGEMQGKTQVLDKKSENNPAGLVEGGGQGGNWKTEVRSQNQNLFLSTSSQVKFAATNRTVL